MAQRVVLVGQTILDSNGYGSTNVVPQGGELTVTLTSVSVSSNTLEPVAKIYLNVIGDSGFVEGTFSGSSDASDSSYIVSQGETLTAVWTGGDVGAIATFRVTGTIG